ncbi:MAG: hypothetical protein RL547_828 [Actinomycetota bacterium]
MGSGEATMQNYDERRLRMRTKFDEIFGPTVAGDLMESLPPFDWTQIATKDDLDRGLAIVNERIANVDQKFDGRFDNVERRLDLMDQRFGQIDREIASLDTKVDKRFETLEKSINSKVAVAAVTFGATMTGMFAGLVTILG